MRHLIKDRLTGINRRFDDMARLKRRVENAVESWGPELDRDPMGEMICHLTEGFSEKPEFMESPQVPILPQSVKG